jgi:glycine cleavage system pyridoxal-binding protein P
MAEQLDLTTPLVPPTRTTYTVIRLLLDWNASVISITVRGSDGLDTVAEYTGATAVTLMNQLNKVDLGVKSLQRRILERLVTDAKLPTGTVSGTPA